MNSFFIFVEFPNVILWCLVWPFFWVDICSPIPGHSSHKQLHILKHLMKHYLPMMMPLAPFPVVGAAKLNLAVQPIIIGAAQPQNRILSFILLHLFWPLEWHCQSFEWIWTYFIQKSWEILNKFIIITHCLMYSIYFRVLCKECLFFSKAFWKWQVLLLLSGCFFCSFPSH